MSYTAVADRDFSCSMIGTAERQLGEFPIPVRFSRPSEEGEDEENAAEGPRSFSSPRPLPQWASVKAT